MPCPLRGLPYREQLARKRERVAAALAARGLGDVAVEDVVGSRDLFGYRNVVKLAVRPGPGGTLRAGVYEPGSHRLADATGCETPVPALGQVVEMVLREAADLGLGAFDERTGRGELRHVVARWSAWQKKALLVLVTGRVEPGRLRELARRVSRREPRLGGVVESPNTEPGNVILGRQFRIVRPPDFLVERVGFLQLRAGAGAFLQVNTWTARRIYETVLEWSGLAAADRALDLFCGVGPLALHLATRCAEVVGIEESPRALEDARANQRRASLGNVRFRAGAVEDLLPEIVASGTRFDVVTLNPPRKGAAASVLEQVAILAPRRILYVSCDPDSLARDLERLRSLGWPTTRVRPFDMMPQTAHVETLALAERG